MEQLDIQDICQGKLSKQFFLEIVKYFNSKNMEPYLVFLPSVRKTDLFDFVWAGDFDNFPEKIKVEISLKNYQREKREFELLQNMIFTNTIEGYALVYGNNLTFKYDNIEDAEDFKELTLCVLF
jgi:hypothetical protein